MNKAEILRYMRTSSKCEDPKILSLVDECMAEVNRCVKPKTIYRIFDCTVTDDKLIVGDYSFESKRLADTVKDCGRVCVFGATLGTECDRLLRTYSAGYITKAMVLQAVMASKIEEICDGIEEELKNSGCSLRRRYSPGYFDLDVSSQKHIFELIDITKRIGVTLTETYEMIPTKSVTAIIGIENED